jgi:ribosomal protein S18 acetylase RimI-like enzyme
MKLQIQIRPSTPADHQFLHRLNRAAYEPLAARLFGSWDESARRARFEDKIQRHEYWIIDLDLQPVGAISSTEHEDHVFLNDLMILPEVQNQGVGSSVLHLELCRGRASGKPLRLHTARLNRAQGFYQRHGFIETGSDEVFINLESPR